MESWSGVVEWSLGMELRSGFEKWSVFTILGCLGVFYKYTLLATTHLKLPVSEFLTSDFLLIVCLSLLNK